MKIIRGLVGLMTVGILFGFVAGVPECGSDEYLEKFAPALADYTFIKSFNVQLSKQDDKSEFSYVFSKGSTYRIVIGDMNPEGNRMIVSLYDRNRKLIASNYVKSSRKFFPSINYACSATGVYYVEAAFENGKTGCGINILGFK
ncbi:MAG: hypothetical protein ACJ77K_13985 [Bacteroidia bacterium]